MMIWQNECMREKKPLLGDGEEEEDKDRWLPEANAFSSPTAHIHQEHFFLLMRELSGGFAFHPDIKGTICVEFFAEKRNRNMSVRSTNIPRLHQGLLRELFSMERYAEPGIFI